MDLKRLALDVARDHFGEPAEIVCRVLFSRNRQAARAISAATQLPLRLVRDVLLVLIQHNVVTWEEDAGNIFYTAHEGLFLVRLRFPAFQWFVHSVFREPGEMLFEYVMLRGRARALDAVQYVAQQMAHARGSSDVAAFVAELRPVFAGLTASGMLEPCTRPPSISAPSCGAVARQLRIAVNPTPDCEGYQALDAALRQQAALSAAGRGSVFTMHSIARAAPPVPSSSGAGRGRGRGQGRGVPPTPPAAGAAAAPGARKRTAPAAEGGPDGLSAMAAAASMLAAGRGASPAKRGRRRQADAGLAVGGAVDDDGATAVAAAAAATTVAAGGSAAAAAAAAAGAGPGLGAGAGLGIGPDGGADGALAADTRVWRVGCRALLEVLRRRALLALTVDRLGPEVQPLMERIMDACAAAPSGIVTRAALEEAQLLPPATLSKQLDLLVHDTAHLLSKVAVEIGSGAYTPNMPALVGLAQSREVDASVRDRFGIAAHRMFRMLARTGQLEQKHLADACLVAPKDARERLYAMLEAGYVGLQEVARSAASEPARNVYLWNVRYDLATVRLAEHILKGLHNVYVRMCMVEQALGGVVALDEEASGAVDSPAHTAAEQCTSALLRVMDSLAPLVWY